MKKLILTALSFLFLVGCTADTEQPTSYRQITMDEAVTMMETETDYILLDVRTHEEFRDEHIPDALNWLFGK